MSYLSQHTLRLSRLSVLWLVLLMLYPSIDVKAQVASAVRAFDEGNQLYLEGRYRQALVSFEQALASGYTSGPLFYNMGNAYYRIDELGEAIRYYEKARQVTPDNRELLHNLDIAQTQTVDQFSQLPTPFWLVGWQKLKAYFGANFFFYLGLFFYLIAAVLLGFRIRYGPQTAWHRRGLSWSAVIGALFLITGFSASLDTETNLRAVVLTQEVTLRQEPSPEGEIETTIHEGLVVNIQRKQAPWIEVQLSNGVTGWMQEQTLGEI